MPNYCTNCKWCSASRLDMFLKNTNFSKCMNPKHNIGRPSQAFGAAKLTVEDATYCSTVNSQANCIYHQSN